MSYLNKKQYEYIANLNKLQIVIKNGMGEEERDIISRLYLLHHILHCSMNILTKNSSECDVVDSLSMLLDRINGGNLSKLYINLNINVIYTFDYLIEINNHYRTNFAPKGALRIF